METTDPGADVRAVTDAATHDARDIDSGADLDEIADVGPSHGEVTEYCELVVDMFCDYYLRCGRVDAADVQDCRTGFLETCNAVFEPQYQALHDLGHLQLSTAGIDACRSHLEQVECQRHIFDLDGPCRDVWEGQQTAGEACAPGVGIFVCEPGTDCVLGLDFCGTCQPAGRAGQPCMEDRCDRESTCIDGTCMRRGLTGDGCDDERPCATGLACENGTCGDYAIAEPGGACVTARCPYQSTCMDGVCVADALLGESCSSAVCASGWCDTEVCQPFREACGDNAQCLSGRCEAAICQPPVSSCL